MRRSDREIAGREEIDAIIRGSQVCRLALAVADEPSVLTMTRVWRIEIDSLTGKRSEPKTS